MYRTKFEMKQKLSTELMTMKKSSVRIEYQNVISAFCRMRFFFRCEKKCFFLLCQNYRNLLAHRSPIKSLTINLNTTESWNEDMKNRRGK